MKYPTYWKNCSDIIGGNNSLDSFSDPHCMGIRLEAVKFILDFKPERVVDVGCNTGIFYNLLQENGYPGDYVGVDSNETAVYLGRKLNPSGHFIISDIGNLKVFDDKEVDIVYTRAIIEHLPDYKLAVKQLCRITKRHLLISFFIPLAKQNIYRKKKEGFWENQYAYREFMEHIDSNGFRKGRLLYQDTHHYGEYCRGELFLFTREDVEDVRIVNPIMGRKSKGFVEINIQKPTGSIYRRVYSQEETRDMDFPYPSEPDL